ncbi:MAG TPA: NUDIX hydrolase, partial [Patescibacteria group bacterium]|nr:NUDIX hydrolase [Patescibacteria group bacterium]
LIVNKEHSVLLVQESDKSWSLPGGAKEEFDTDIIATLHRELEEELGLYKKNYSVIATDISVSFVYDERSKSRQGQGAKIDLFIITLLAEAQIKPNNEINNVRWSSINEAIKMMRFDEHRELVQRGNDYLLSLKAKE